MKKIKKGITLVLTLVMLLSVATLPAMAEGEPVSTTLTPTADAYMGDSWVLSTNSTSTDVYTHKNYNGDSSYPGGYVGDVFGWNYIRVATFAYDITNVSATLAANPDYQIKSAKFKPYAKYWGNAVKDINFYNINAQWDETSILSKTQKTIYEILPIDSTETNGPKFGTPDLTVVSSYASRAAAENTASYVQDEYDITPLLRKHISNHSSDSLQNFFSFAMEIVAESGNMEYIMQSKESEYGAQLVVEYTKPEGILVKTPPASEGVPDDDVIIEFNNPIASCSVKVNGIDFESGVTINDAKITIDYPFAQNETYSIAISVEDTYGNKFEDTYEFTVLRDITETTQKMGLPKYANMHTLYSDGKLKNEYSSIQLYYNHSSEPDAIAFFKIPMIALPQTGYLDKAVLSFYANGNAPADGYRVFKFAGENWKTLNDDGVTVDSSDNVTGATTYADVKDIVSDFDAYKAGDVTIKEDIGSGYYRYSIDLTEYANECAGQSNIWLGITAQGTATKLFYNQNKYEPYITYTVANSPEFKIADVQHNVTGTTLDALSFSLHTVFDKQVLEAALALADSKGNKVDNVNFVYNSNSNKVELSDGVMLDEQTEYSVTIESGISDKFGNLLEDDLTVCTFTTGKSYDIANIIFVDGDLEVDSDAAAYDSLDSIDDVLSQASVKAAVKFANNTNSPITVWLLAASYNANGALISIGMNDGTWIGGQSAKTLSTTSFAADGADKVKAFVWDYFNTAYPLAVNCTIGAAR